MGFFSKLFGGKSGTAGGGASSSGPLREFIDGALPKNYTQSPKYAVSIQGSAARITLDMLADGSDYQGFGDADYTQLAEFESSYLLTGCLASPPEPVDFTLEMVFGGGRSATVERKAGADTGFLTWKGERREISF